MVNKHEKTLNISLVIRELETNATDVSVYSPYQQKIPSPKAAI